MSILTECLPESVMVDGFELPVSWDYQTMLQIDERLTADLPEETIGEQVLQLFYGFVPEAVEDAIQAMIWFFRCGKKPEERQDEGENADPKEPDFSYAHDAELIFAAFWAQYGIDLTEQCLHWWKFRALFDSLTADHLFSEVRKCRVIKPTKDMTREQKRYYRMMKKLYQLPKPEKEQKEVDELTAALMGDGNVMGVLYGSKEG